MRSTGNPTKGEHRGERHSRRCDLGARRPHRGRRDRAQILLTLAQLERAYDASRTVVREAVRVLESIGVVVSRRRVGITVQRCRRVFSTITYCWILAGFMVVIVGANANPWSRPLKRMIPLTAVYAPFMSLVVALIAGPITGAVDGHFAQLWGAGIISNILHRHVCNGLRETSSACSRSFRSSAH